MQYIFCEPKDGLRRTQAFPFPRGRCPEGADEVRLSGGTLPPSSLRDATSPESEEAFPLIRHGFAVPPEGELKQSFKRSHPEVSPWKEEGYFLRLAASRQSTSPESEEALVQRMK